MSVVKLNRGEIYYANLEPVKGSEQGGSRPVLIVSNKFMNERSPITGIVPMTTKDKVKAGPFNISYKINDISLNREGIEELVKSGFNIEIRDGIFLGSHARVISKNRLIGNIGILNNNTVMHGVENAIIDTFGLDACKNCGAPQRPGGLICGHCGHVHRIKCIDCGFIFELDYYYCPMCGKEVKP